MPLTNGSGSCYFRHWPSRCKQKTKFLTQFFCLLLFEGTFTFFFKDKKSNRTWFLGFKSHADIEESTVLSHCTAHCYKILIFARKFAHKKNSETIPNSETHKVTQPKQIHLFYLYFFLLKRHPFRTLLKLYLTPQTR